MDVELFAEIQYNPLQESPPLLLTFPYKRRMPVLVTEVQAEMAGRARILLLLAAVALVAVHVRAEKEGNCPPDTGSLSGCDLICDTDEDCSGEQKCCAIDGMKNCVDPE
ncbi:Protein of unknown function [Gryllus bimaculatus]|nr:Protein of unknown function [Gryllus bimaculatus]